MDEPPLVVAPVNKDAGACSACGSYTRVVEIRAGSAHAWITRLCQTCSLQLMGSLAQLYGVSPVVAISDNPELLQEFERLREQLNTANATMRRLQAYVTQGN